MASISIVAKREYGQVPTFHQSIDLRIKGYTKDAPGILYFRPCRLAMTLVLPNGRHSIGAMHFLQGRALRRCPATLASLLSFTHVIINWQYRPQRWSFANSFSFQRSRLVQGIAIGISTIERAYPELDSHSYVTAIPQDSTHSTTTMSAGKKENISLESLPSLLENDTKVKLAGIDVDGMLRGKLISKKKFLSVAKEGFGFCSVIFGWDMHDRTYFKELKISNAENGYHDLIAIPDLSSFRRIPWEDDVPFFLVSFFDPDSLEPISACPRGLLKMALEPLKAKGLGAMAGGMISRTAVPGQADIGLHS
jgi:hypothetical protein